VVLISEGRDQQDMPDATVDRGVKIEMRDGTTLRADVYSADSAPPSPTLLVRTPYDRTNLAVHTSMIDPLDAVDAGFAVVLQDCRGRYSSAGDWRPFVNGEQDGYDTVEWIADQKWCDGQVAAIGGSYAGVTTWQTAVADPPHLEAVVPMITTANIHDGWVYTGGALELGFLLRWITKGLLPDELPTRESPEAHTVRRQFESLYRDLEKALRTLPLDDISLFDAVGSYYRSWLDHPPTSEHWRNLSPIEKFDRISVPILEIAGWYDKFAKGAFDAAAALERQGHSTTEADHYVVYGPWEHLSSTSPEPNVVGDLEIDSGSVFAAVTDELVLRWLERQLENDPSSADELPRLQYYQFGTGSWKTRDRWPPTSRRTEYYLDADDATGDIETGVLAETPPTKEGVDTYRYDPTDPVPTRGGNTFMRPITEAGPKNQYSIQRREDVLVYTTPALNEAVSVLGCGRVDLFISSSAPDTDFTAKLVDVRRPTKCVNVAEGIQRARYRDGTAEPEYLSPNEVHRVSIELWPTSYQFAEDSRIRLEISSSNFPRFDRNPNVEASVARVSADEMQVATNRVIHSPTHPSKLILPVEE
jgi:putative CocE/NonD family hydrolase